MHGSLIEWTVVECYIIVIFIGLCLILYSTNQYMGFGLSGSASSTQMFGADPTITWVDETDGPQAIDYYLSAYSPVRTTNKLSHNIVILNLHSSVRMVLGLVLMKWIPVDCVPMISVI